LRHGRRRATPRCFTPLLRLLRSRSLAAASIGRCYVLLPPSLATSRSGPRDFVICVIFFWPAVALCRSTFDFDF
jgi:hypothetical protein